MADRPKVSLRVPGAGGQLTFFRKMVIKPERAIEPGSIVDVIDRQGKFVGRGFYNPRSEVAVRILTTETGDEDGVAFLDSRLRSAIAFRHDVLKLPAQTGAYRVCHAEGDGLSGLIIDRYGPVVVAELFSRGWFKLLDRLRATVAELLPQTTLHVRADAQTMEWEGFALPPAPAVEPVVVEEHGVNYRVDVARGHKTGFFCDQRENRRAVAGLAAGRNVLDLCAYTGGFALNAALAGAARVTGVDLDEEALATARHNAQLNRAKVEFLHADLFNYLKQLKKPAAHDLVVLDPPKMARDREELPKARRGYRDMNALAMNALAPGGILVSCSCSGLVGEPEFLDILRDASRLAGRELRIFRVAGAGPDHPVSSRFPEGRYLKAVFSVVA